MTTTGIIALVAIGLVAVASAVIGSIGVRVARSTSDFFVASRTVGPMANAGAISGEYLSAASFLGIAGLILRDGVDALWYPVGYTAGYLALVLFVSAPLRRSGAYTVPDFAEYRLRSGVLRRVCAVFVVVIGWLYLLPQLQGAGLTVATVTGLPDWTGAAVAAFIVVATVVLGGMRSITFVQAFQYWLKLTALALPAIIAAIFFFSDDRTFDKPAPPQFPDRATVEIHTPVELQVTEPVQFTATGVVDGRQVIDGPVRWEVGRHTVEAGAELDFPAGAAVPVVVGAPASDASWLAPFPEGREHGLLATYSLILALFLGTMGLPHVLVRFYTNPDGRAARRTAVFVLALLGCFYLAVTLLGALSRLYTPQLLVSGDTDAAVLLLPTAVLGSGLAGALLGGLVAAGAWAAFLSTASGLIVSIAGVLSTDLIGSSRVRDFRLSAVLAGAVPLAMALLLTRLDFGEAVALVFAVAASTFCPLLVLGIWWRGLTAAGGIAGILVGGIGSAGAVALSLAGFVDSGWLGVLLYRPAIATVPAAFLTMILVSRMTARYRPVDADQVLLRLHAPERLGLSRDRLEDRQRPTW
ncbi:sodium:solute symporter family protein [Pseudonocardia hierapolitana]|uniref:Sodium:solute symporter family protein n=1 Tax=Pseudonocardia hierapolitana TaxID=1128676 RepID=A0A561SRE8_9PSEU|nr:cation acetate symporter [Pseudonocardia hierapolitana]TWF77421.1 sodium:solute symporter family protein [Pseudonocardia hierapolitana]